MVTVVISFLSFTVKDKRPLITVLFVTLTILLGVYLIDRLILSQKTWYPLVSTVTSLFMKATINCNVWRLHFTTWFIFLAWNPWAQGLHSNFIFHKIRHYFLQKVIQVEMDTLNKHIRNKHTAGREKERYAKNS
jgi:hypothetical protein